MKKLILLSAITFLFSCGDRNEKVCNCTQQRWEKKIVRNIQSQAVVSETDWQKVGPEKSAGTDCSKNGGIPVQGNTANMDPGYTTSTETHYQERVTCQ